MTRSAVESCREWFLLNSENANRKRRQRQCGACHFSRAWRIVTGYFVDRERCVTLQFGPQNHRLIEVRFIYEQDLPASARNESLHYYIVWFRFLSRLFRDQFV